MKKLIVIMGMLIFLVGSTQGIDLKEDTAVTIKIGPFLDETDGKTAEEGLTIAQTDVEISKNGGAFAALNDANGATHDSNGWYALPIDITDTGTLGYITITVHESGALPVWQSYNIVTANWWDSKYSTDKLQVDSVEINSDTTAADNLDDFWDTTNSATYMIEMMITDHATNYDGTLNLFVVDANKVAGAAPLSAANITDNWETQAQADPTGFHVNVYEIGGQSQTANDNGADINTIVTAVGNIETDTAAQDTAGEWDGLMATAIGEVNDVEVKVNTIDGIVDTITGDVNDVEVKINAISAAAAGFDSTTAASGTSGSVFVITDGVILDNVYKGLLITVTDASGDNDPEPAFVENYASGTKTITLSSALSFTPASGDTVVFLSYKKVVTPWSR